MKKLKIVKIEMTPGQIISVESQLIEFGILDKNGNANKPWGMVWFPVLCEGVIKACVLTIKQHEELNKAFNKIVRSK